MRSSSSTRLTVAAAIAGLALGGVLYAVSRGGSDDDAATKHVQPVPSGSLPAEAAGEPATQQSVIDGFWMGMAKRSVQFG